MHGTFKDYRFLNISWGTVTEVNMAVQGLAYSHLVGIFRQLGCLERATLRLDSIETPLPSRPMQVMLSNLKYLALKQFGTAPLEPAALQLFISSLSTPVLCALSLDQYHMNLVQHWNLGFIFDLIQRSNCAEKILHPQCTGAHCLELKHILHVLRNLETLKLREPPSGEDRWIKAMISEILIHPPTRFLPALKELWLNRDVDTHRVDLRKHRPRLRVVKP